MKKKITTSKVFNEGIFWVIQVAIWSLFFLYELQFLYMEAKSNFEYTFYLIVDAFTGFALTSMLRYLYSAILRKWTSEIILLFTIFIISTIFANIWFFENYAFWIKLSNDEHLVKSLNLFIYLRSFLALFVILFSWSFIYLFLILWKTKNRNHKLTLVIKELRNQKLQVELQTLKSQLNPHFLFNVLNNIYSNSLIKSDITAEVVLRLSNLMKYVLIDCNSDLIPLDKEVEFFRNYIKLEKIRLEEDFDVNFVTKNIEGVLIPSLIFTPLIENVFKHGITSVATNNYIKINMEVSNNKLFFILENSKQPIMYTQSKQNKKGGIGIENVRKRLKLLYPGEHEVSIEDEMNMFRIIITINNILQ